MFPTHYNDLPPSVIIGLYEQAYNSYLSQVDFAENQRDSRQKFHVDDKKMDAEYNYEMTIISIENKRLYDTIKAQEKYQQKKQGARLQQEIRKINTIARKAGVKAKFSKQKVVKDADRKMARILKQYPKGLEGATREFRKILRMWETYAPKPTSARPNGVSLPLKSY